MADGQNIVAWRPPQDIRIDADATDLRQQIFDEGRRVRWEKAMRCACNFQAVDQSNSGLDYVGKEGDYVCPECQGVGYLYYGAQEIKALVAETSGDPQWLKVYGEVMDGSVALTILSEQAPGKRDRFVILDKTHRYTEQKKRPPGPIQRLTYPIVTVPTTVGSDADDSIATIHDLSVLYARRADENGHITDDPMVVGVDFDVTADGYVEYIEAGTQASGVVWLVFDPSEVSQGDIIPAGFLFTTTDNISYTTDFASVAYVDPDDNTLVLVKITAVAVGTGGNLAADATANWTSIEFPTIGFLRVPAYSEVSGGTDSGTGGNVPAVGAMTAWDYYHHPAYIVRKMPHLSREAYIATPPPYVNATTGYKGYWNASLGTLPSNSGVLVGDYYEVGTAGTVDGVEFAVGDVIVALVDAPSETQYAGWWFRMQPGQRYEPRLMRLSTMVLCWPEDMGDPFGRSGPTP